MTGQGGDERPDPSAVVQAAAIEAIKAFRSFLDVAEQVVRDPQQAVVVGRAFADAARSMFDQQGRSSEDEGRDEDAQPRVRRINLSE